MAGHVDRFLKVGFPTEIRMFMEDIVFQTRFKENGRILLAPNSGLKHEPDSRGRLSDIDSTEKWDYMRERMVLQFPQYFSRRIFYLEVLMMMIADLVRMRISALGHIRFLLRTAFGRSKVYDFRNVETPGW